MKSPRNATGLTNAFATVNKLVNTASGALAVAGGGNGGSISTTLPANATLPGTLINTLGDILEQCIDSASGSASDTTDSLTNGTGCGKPFYLTPNSAGPIPPTPSWP